LGQNHPKMLNLPPIGGHFRQKVAYVAISGLSGVLLAILFLYRGRAPCCGARLCRDLRCNRGMLQGNSLARHHNQTDHPHRRSPALDFFFSLLSCSDFFPPPFSLFAELFYVILTARMRDKRQHVYHVELSRWVNGDCRTNLQLRLSSIWPKLAFG